MIGQNDYKKVIEEVKEKKIYFALENYQLNAEYFHTQIPYFYDESGIWWFWDATKHTYIIKDDIGVMLLIDETLNLNGQTIKSTIKNNYIEAFKRVGRKNIPKDPPAKWIQFKNKAISLSSKKVYDVTPEYFFTNPIPWELGDTSETPHIDKLLTDWVGEKYKDDLYEIISYCCYRDYPIQSLVCLYGTGRNGKSQFIRLLIKFLGVVNCCSTELDLLANPSSRFESIKLYKKLMCSMGETNFGTMQNTSMLKKLVGGDLVNYEIKGKTPFDGYNYAKILIGSNSLPTTDDTSDGFMRRWHIIDFPNEFAEGRDVIVEIPDEEFENLARKVMVTLPTLLERGSFKNMGTIEFRKHRYTMASNPLPLFIKERCDVDPSHYVQYNHLYTEYVQWLLKHKKRKVKTKEFRSSLENEGYYLEKTSKKLNGEFVNGYWILGIKTRNCDNCDNSAENPTQFYSKELVGNSVTKSTIVTKQKNINSLEDFSYVLHEVLGNDAWAPGDLHRQHFKDTPIDLFDIMFEKALNKGIMYEIGSGKVKLLK